MGCFNVACSVSNISIGHGERVVYIPLLPNNWILKSYPEYKHHTVGTHSHLIYSNCYFNPLTFPIKGYYNDYGSLEDIDSDANTEAIEKFFGMPIEDFVKSAERNWCREYIDDQKEITKNFFNKPELFNNVRKDSLTKEFMAEMGFEEQEDYSFTYKDLPYKVMIRTGNKEGYYILEKESEKEVKKREHSGFYRNYLLSDLADLTGYYIGIAEEYQEKIHILENLSGMFIHEEIYDELIKGCSRADIAPTKDILEELGFVLDPNKKIMEDREESFYYHPEVEDQKSFVQSSTFGSAQAYDKDTADKHYGDFISSTYDLAERYIEKHGVILNLTSLEKQSSSLFSFKNIQEAIKAHKVIEKIDYSDEDLSPELQDLMKKHSLIFGHPLDKMSLRKEGLWCFEDWNYLKEIYSDCFEDGSIEEEYCEWVAAKGSMFSANVFFFPTMNGEQHGNDQESKKVLEKSLSVVNRRIKEYEEESCC